MSEYPSGTITFLFTDVQDSTKLWEMRPAGMAKVLKRHDEIIEEITKHHDGYIVRPRGEGDSRFIVFKRALDGVRTAAAIQQALHAEEWPKNLDLQVRMGVHTGEGEFRDGDYYGTAVNRCARLRDTANGGQILVSQSTFDLVQDHLPGDIQLLNLGKRPLKGLVRSEQTYQLLAPGIPKAAPFLSADRTGFSPPTTLPRFLQEDPDRDQIRAKRPVFVGREGELTQLQSSLEKVCKGNGQVVFITGEAGRGKSALAQHFARKALDEHSDLLVAFGESNAQSGLGDPYLPFRELLDMLTGGAESSWSIGRISAEGAARLWSTMPFAINTILDVGPDLIDRVIPSSSLEARAQSAGGGIWEIRLKEFLERKASYQTSTPVKQIDLFEQFTRVIRHLAEEGPLLLVLDDFQWADDASISLLFHLARRITDRPVLLLCAYRPDEVAMGRDDDRHPLEQVVNELNRRFGEMVIDLGAPDPAEGREFIDAFLDSEPNRLGDDFRRALFNHTGGHPLFTVELLRAMQDRGDLVQNAEGAWVEGDHLDWDTLPLRVEAVVKERIARLEEDIRELLHVASVEGTDFTAQVVARVQNIEERKLLQELSQKLSKRHSLIRDIGEMEVGHHILSKYQFAHHLFQRYLYSGLSSAERRLLHGEITTVLEELFGDEVDRVAVQLAYHSQRARLQDKAVRYLRMAGDQARESYANQEAIRHYSDLLDLLPDQTIKRFEALSQRSRVYDVLAQRQAQLRDAEEMLAIAEGLDEDDLRVDALLAIADAYLESEHVLAAEPIEKALTLSRKLDDPVREASALRRLGWSTWLKGDYAGSRGHLEKAVALFQEEEIPEKAARCLHILSLAMGRMYERPAAMEAARKAVELSRQVGDPRLEATSLRRLAIAHNLLDQYEEALPITKRALALHREVGDWSEEAAALNVLGSIYGWLDRWKESEAAYRESLELGHDLGSTTAVEFAAWNLATSHFWRQGQYEQAVRFFDRELKRAQVVEDHWLIIMLNSRQGWVLYEMGLFEASLECFMTALSGLQQLAPDGPVYIETLAWIGLQQAELGNFDLAKEHVDRSRDLAHSLKVHQDRIMSKVTRGKVSLLLGDPDRMEDAHIQLENHLRIIAESSDYPYIEEGLNTSAQLYLAQGDMEGALERTQELVRLLDYAPVHPAPQDYAYTHAQVLMALGREEEAIPYLQRAYNWVKQVADNFENEDWRRTWLEDACRNKEILALAENRNLS